MKASELIMVECVNIGEYYITHSYRCRIFDLFFDTREEAQKLIDKWDKSDDLIQHLKDSNHALSEAYLHVPEELQGGIIALITANEELIKEAEK
jgi:hypothetical protein